MKINNDFMFDISTAEACQCDANESESSLKIYDSNGTSSSENEDDYFERILPEITEEELKGLTLQVENPLKCLKPILEFIDPRMYEKIVSYIDPKHFFVEEKEKKIIFLSSAPNSYFPILKKPLESTDLICAPSYLTEKEEELYVRPFFVDTSRFSITNRGMTIKFDLDDRTDEQSNYILNQGLFYEGLVKHRLVNGGKENTEDHDYDFPINIFEPVTFLKRFCEVFYYVNLSFSEICGKNLTEDVIIKKFSSGLFSGFHKILASQGIPLPSLIGETYQVTDKTGNLEIFAEVKNNKPLIICYNIRWKKRTAMIDGTVEFSFEYDEDQDKLNIFLKGTNKLRILTNQLTYNTIYFNFPQSLTILNIVDHSEFKNERSMTVNGIMYFKGEVLTAIFNLNFMDLLNFSLKIIGFLKKGTNLNTLKNGHSFVGFLFDSAGFEFPKSVKYSEIMNELFFKKTIRKNNIKPDRNKSSYDISGIKHDTSNISRVLDKSNEKSLDKSDIYFNKSKNHKKSVSKMNTRINKNPNSYLNKIFLKVIEDSLALIKTSEFMLAFPEGYVNKVFMGSWIKMNYYEVDLNKDDELSEYYLIFDSNSMKLQSHSVYNKKKALNMPWDNFEFFKTLKNIYKEDNWQYVKNPLPCDTRYREDFLWLLRFYQIIGRTAGYKEKREEELNSLRLEAIINAGKWKDLLDVYVFYNISKRINQTKDISPIKK